MKIAPCPVCGIMVFHDDWLDDWIPVMHHGPCGRLCNGGTVNVGEPTHDFNCEACPKKKRRKGVAR